MRRLVFSLTLVVLPFVAYTELVNVNGTQLNVEKMGRGFPLIVVHGGPGFDQNYLRPHLDPLAARHKVYFYDQRCCGKSLVSVSARELTVDQSVKDLESLRKELKIEQFALLAHSWGGQIAMRYAIKYPNRVTALVLLDTFPASTDGIQDLSNNFASKTAVNAKVLDQIFNSTPFIQNNPAVVESYYQMLYSPMLHNPKEIKKINFALSAQSAVNISRVQSMLFNDLVRKPFDLHQQLSKIDVPTLIIHGEEDFIPTYSAKKIQRAIPNAKYIEIADAGHFSYAEKQEETLDEIFRFLGDNVTEERIHHQSLIPQAIEPIEAEEAPLIEEEFIEDDSQDSSDDSEDEKPVVKPVEITPSPEPESKSIDFLPDSKSSNSAQLNYSRVQNAPSCSKSLINEYNPTDCFDDCCYEYPVAYNIHPAEIEARVSYFYPTSTNFRKVYPTIFVYGLEANYYLWKNWYLWGSAGYLGSSGHTSQNHKTTTTCYPLGIGLKAYYPFYCMDFYVGAGFLATHVDFDDHSSHMIRNSSEWAYGGILKSGAIINICDNWFADLFLDYTMQNVHFTNTDHHRVERFKTDLSGISTGIGIGYRFNTYIRSRENDAPFSVQLAQSCRNVKNWITSGMRSVCNTENAYPQYVQTRYTRDPYGECNGGWFNWCSPFSDKKFEIEARAAYFYPVDSDFHDTYKNPWMYGAEVNVPIHRNFYAFGSANYLSKSGRSSLGSPTTITLVPLAFGFKGFIHPIECIDLYAGAGLLATHVNIKDKSPYVIQHNSKWAFGGILKSGAVFNIAPRLFIDLFLDYTLQNVYFHSDNHDRVKRSRVDLSGVSGGIGLGYRFGNYSRCDE